MLMLINWMLPVLLFLTGAYVYVSNRKHLLVTLLSLEFMVLGLFMLMMYLFNLLGITAYFSLVFLVFSVCEGALGLSVLVSMIRTHGNDYLSSFNVLNS